MNRQDKIDFLKQLQSGKKTLADLPFRIIDLTNLSIDNQNKVQELLARNQHLWKGRKTVSISELPDEDARFIYSIHTKNNNG